MHVKIKIVSPSKLRFFAPYNSSNGRCKYWPIYPCHSGVRRMVDCLLSYGDDGIVFASETQNHPLYMSAVRALAQTVTELTEYSS